MSSFDELIQLLESFEQVLGNPLNESSPVTFQQSLLFDEQECLAEPQIEFLKQWGYCAYLIPHSLGGSLTSLLDLYSLNKLIARRDITTALALGLPFLGALAFWISGTPEQKKQLAQRLKQGEVIALALTEEEHGSDLTNNEMRGKAHREGWTISGRKWCVNYATLSEMATVLCRTHDQGGLLGFSLFFIDKKQIKTQMKFGPKLPTHGVRGLDISSFELDEVALPKEALIGKERRGLELTYKVFQVSRLLCTCLSVGGADTALRLTLSFSLERILYGNPAYEIPAVKQRLGEQFTQLLIADCTALVIVRACTVMPEKMSLWSAIIKLLIPKICDDVVEQSAIILGARAYLRTTEWAVFQKIRRDIQVVGLFDGSSQVNLSLIAGNLLPQAGMRGSAGLANGAFLEQIFDMSLCCPDFEGDKLRLFTHEEDAIFAGLLALDCEPINPLIQAIREQITLLDQRILNLRDEQLLDPRGLAAFRLAEQYCWIFAACCCLQFWYYNRTLLSEVLRDTAWITLAVQLVLNKLNSTSFIDQQLQEVMADHLCLLYRQNKLFSVIPVPLAE